MTSPAELANQPPEVRAALEMSDLLRRAGTGWLLFAKKMPDIFDAALSVLEARLEQAEKALNVALEDQIWMSGADDFGPDGKAHEGWLKVRERLYENLALARGVVGETSGTKAGE